MSKKKIIWIILLVVIIIAVITVIILARPKENINTNTDTAQDFSKNTNTITNTIEQSNTYSQKEKVDCVKTELEDGTLYSFDGNKVNVDMVIGTNYFDTTITDVYLNPQNYYGKNIEIEGMFLSNEPYTFVGRYSTSNLCQYCPVGYSFMEYEFDGKIDTELVDEQTWIKIVGKLEKGNDETSNYEDYYYLKVSNFEIMKQRGEDTVNN